MNDSKAYYDQDNGIAIGYFSGFISSEEFKIVAEQLHQLRVKHKSQKQLNNVEHMKVLTADIVKWLNEVWFKEARQTGLKYFAFVVPKDIYGKVSMSHANRNVHITSGIEIEYFFSESEAKNWLNSKT
jgi:hypothetical protein